MFRCSELCKLVDIEASKIIKNIEHMSIKYIHSMMGTCYNIYCLYILYYTRDFPAFQNLGPGALDFGKK